ncbi:MAG: manganese efflux pump [Clostridia bacterium]|nr:manganese efflux pump [Clostridia bacterium]
MDWTMGFFLTSALLGVGLAMDAFSVSLANGLNEPGMSRAKTCGIAGVFAFFQALMPMTGWFLVHTMVSAFEKTARYIPIAALIMLLAIGGKMVYEGMKQRSSPAEKPAVGLWALLVQGVATSIDALSVGFTVSEYDLTHALVCALMIAAVTFAICIAGLLLGRRIGTRLSWKASVLGGVILICIGIEIFVKSLIS